MVSTSARVASRGDAERARRTVELFDEVAEGRLGRELAQDSVVTLHLSVARALARRYRGRGLELEDLEQAACLALVRAARGFDPLARTDFMSYAVPTIRGALKKQFRDYGWAVRPPRRVQELQPRIARHVHDTDAETGRPLSDQQLADRLGVTLADVRESAAASGCFRTASLDVSVGAGASRRVAALTVVEEAGFSAAEARATLAPVLGSLSAPERHLLRLRFVDDRTQKEIADLLGLTQATVSRSISRLVSRLHQLLEGDHQVQGLG